jgi:hypothetical protein
MIKRCRKVEKWKSGKVEKWNDSRSEISDRHGCQEETYGHIIGELEDELAVDRTVFHDISCLIQREERRDQLDVHVGIYGSPAMWG